MQLEPEIALEAARTVRPYLDELAGADADALDAALADALAANDAAAAEAILLTPALRAWAASFARYGVPEDLVEPDTLRGFQRMPGVGLPVRAPRYACPHGDYVWFKRAGSPIPRCPTHGERVVRA